ncbi:Hypothetical protein HVR_LOCUS1323 [uncultured virus]|nr:Hypothetical protein HVR_LOCUS1323 [uncultured virus]
MTVHRVVDIDWSNKDIDRVGVIPIILEFGKRWIGLEVNRITSNITTIGGRFEPKDHDLLDTAVREYNEEVGSNMKHITVEILQTCYAFRSKSSISIFLPLMKRPDKIVPTEELYDMLWVTSKQLRIMAKYQEYRIINGAKKGESKPKAFIFSRELAQCSNDIADIVDHEDILTPISLSITNRPRKIRNLDELIIIQDTQRFESDLIINNWRLVFGVVLNGLCAIYVDVINILYLIPVSDVKDLLHNWKGQLLMSNDDDINSLFGLMNRLRCCSIQSYAQHAINNRTPNFLINFDHDLNIARSNFGISRIIMELNLLYNIESQIYDQARKTGTFFYQKRADLLRGINIVNIILSDPSLNHDKTSIVKSMKFSSQLDHRTIINIMLATNLVSSVTPENFNYDIRSRSHSSPGSKFRNLGGNRISNYGMQQSCICSRCHASKLNSHMLHL